MARTYWSLKTLGNFFQNWTNTGLITANDDWASVPSIVGYLGQNITTATGTDPSTLTTDSAVAGDVDVIANLTATTSTSGGVGEFQITDPTIGLQGSATADAPYIAIYLDTTDRENIVFSFRARDLDGTADNAAQQIAVQYRVGDTGAWINLPAGFISDATTGPSTLGPDTLISVTLPAGANNQSMVEVRVITANAVGSDEWVGIDDIGVSSDALSTASIAISPTSITQNEGNSGATAYDYTLTRTSTATDTSVDVTITGGAGINAADITSVTINGVPVAGFTLGTAFSVALTGSAATASVQVNVAGDTSVEGNEAFTVTLSAPTGGFTLGTSSATGAITNDDVGIIPIYTIQGNGTASPLLGQVVVTQGVVTAVDTNGFYIQDATGDADTATSDGIFVFTSTAPGAGVVVGNLVQVTGTVNEFAGSTAGASTTTQITGPTVALITAGVGVPAATLISTDGTGRAPPTTAISPDGIAFWESLEGMRVTLQTPLVVANTNSNGTFGETYVVVSNGVGATGLNDRFGVTISNGDFNPERIQIDDDAGIFAGYTPNHTQGDVLANVTGIVNYGFAEYELIVTEAVTTTTDRTLARETTTLTGSADRVTYASFNVENLDPTDPQTKFDRHAIEIVNGLRNPDIIGLQEIQDADGAGSGSNLSGAATAQRLIDAIAAAGGPIYRYVEVAPSVANSTGGEPGGNIRNGYLYNTARVTYVDGSAALIDTAAYTGSRRPLVADFMFNGERFTAINLHSSSRIGSDPLWGATQPPANAGDTSRTNQANGVRSFIDAALAVDATRRFIVNGDFNGFTFETALQSLTAGNVVRNLYDLLPAQEQYSYIFQGNYQPLDHILVTGSLYNSSELDIVHYNAGYTDGLSATDHDQPLARITQARAGGAGVAIADNFATTEAAFYRGTVLANDTGGGAGLVVTTVNGIAAGTTQTLASGARLTLLTDGSFTYDPDGAFDALNTGSNGNDSFSYTILGGSTSTVTVTIGGISAAAPTAGDNLISGTPNDDVFDLSAGGADTVSGGAGNDAFSFGASFSALDRINGGSGINDQVGINGSYSGASQLVLNANTLTNVEVLALLPGAGNSYDVVSNDATVAAGQELVVFAGNLGVGQAFTFNGSAETDGSFRTYGGSGTDTITGGALSDGFYFGPGRWQAGDAVVGGGGTNDQLALDGDYAITIGAEADVETLVLLPGPAGTPNTFAITLADAWVASGTSRTVFARNVTTAVTINGAAETDGVFTIFGGRAGDTLTGGAGDDMIWGMEGDDAITGGAGTGDTASFQGVRASYSVVTNMGNVQIVDNDAVTDGNDGTDTVVGIELARFTDQTISITSPIILDLDGGGVTTLSARASNASYDMNGDGVGDDTSWFGRGEGMLFLDRDGNGTLSNAGEFSFTGDVPGARSDLEGLAAFDSNRDGQLSSADARFSNFKIWRDRNGNGVVDAREIMTLRQAGVRSLNLTGTANNATTALGDVAIVNRGSFTRTNGRTAGFIDAALTAFVAGSTRNQSAAALRPTSDQVGLLQSPTLVSGSDPVEVSPRASAAGQRATDPALFTGSFADALAQIGPVAPEQRAMPVHVVSPFALAAADADADIGTTSTIDQRVLLMRQDMAAFAAGADSSSADRWRREGTTAVELFAA